MGVQPVADGGWRRHRRAIGDIVDGLCFLLATVAMGYLAVVLAQDGLTTPAWGLTSLVVVWAITAYLVLPRVHAMLTAVYVPGYYIGRSRTGDGLLGDPVNLALDGSAAQIHATMRRAGWTLADPISLGSSVRIVSSSLGRRSYPEAPVSSLYLFGRRQEFAYQQEVEGNPQRRHHVRFWRCPAGWLLPGGRRVDWLAAGTYDRAVGLSLFTLQITHKIDADIDVERDHIIDTAQEAEAAVRVEVLRNFSTGYHSRNGGGDLIRTDGHLPVLDLRGVKADEVDLETARVAGDATAVAGDRGATDRLPTKADPRSRPASIVAGTVIALAMLVFSIIGTFFGSVQTSDAEVEADDTSSAVAVVLLGVLVALVVINALSAVLTYLGHSWARHWVVLTSGLTAFSLLAQRAGTGHLVDLSIVETSAYVLITYLLTSPSAKDWCRREG